VIAASGKMFLCDDRQWRQHHDSPVTAPTGQHRIAHGAVHAGQSPFHPDESAGRRDRLPDLTARGHSDRPIDAVRFWSSGTILADGRVLVTGGSQSPTAMTGVDYRAEIWDPKTGHWTAGASAAKPRCITQARCCCRMPPS